MCAQAQIFMKFINFQYLTLQEKHLLKVKLLLTHYLIYEGKYSGEIFGSTQRPLTCNKKNENDRLMKHVKTKVHGM